MGIFFRTPKNHKIHKVDGEPRSAISTMQVPADADCRHAIKHPLPKEAIGAKCIDLEWVQVHPTGLVKPDDADAKIKFLAAEDGLGNGGNVFRGPLVLGLDGGCSCCLRL